MTDYLLAVLFGIVEGVTEFLPISSTAHLRVIKPLCGISLKDPYWKMFDVVIQLGAVMCLPIFFRSRIFKFLTSFPKSPVTGQRDVVNHPVTLVGVAFALTGVLGLAGRKLAGENLEKAWVIGWALLAGGVVMWIVDVFCNRPRTQDVGQMNILQAIWIGALQILAAIFPGLSRSMTTIAAGQTAGLSRPASLEFSFFLSIPTMAAACLYDLYKTIRGTHDPGDLAPNAMTSHQWITLAIGFVVSFIVAWVVVAWFMGWVRKRGFVPFAVYRIILGVLVLLLAGRLS